MLVIDRMYELVRWYLGHLAKFPRSQRYGLGARIEGKLYAVLEGLVEARYTPPAGRQALLTHTNAELQSVRTLTRLAHELALLSHKSHEYAARELVEIGSMVGGWSKQQQSTRDLFERLTSWENLLRAARQARRGKRRQPEVAAFELERERELLRIQDELRSGTYRPGRYRGFWVREPKRRLISAAPYRDRVVHHALVNLIGPLFERNFVTDSYANQIGKGTLRAVNRYQHFAQRYRYVMQFDIVKFFPSLDHAVLKEQLRSRIRDERVLWLCDTIIDASNPQEWVCDYFAGDDLFTPMQRRRGLPIGNLTSQFWAKRVPARAGQLREARVALSRICALRRRFRDLRRQ